MMLYGPTQDGHTYKHFGLKGGGRHVNSEYTEMRYMWDHPAYNPKWLYAGRSCK